MANKAKSYRFADFARGGEDGLELQVSEPRASETRQAPAGGGHVRLVSARARRQSRRSGRSRLPHRSAATPWKA